MQNSEEADLGAEMFAVPGDREHRFGSGPEENTVDGVLVVKGDGSQLFRDRENDMEVLHRKHLRLSVFEPLCPFPVLTFRAVAVAAGNGDLSITCLMGSFL
jgi:hypothetical protein